MHSVLQLIVIAIFSKSFVLLVEAKPHFAKRDPGVINPNNLETVDENSAKEVSYDDYPVSFSKILVSNRVFKMTGNDLKCEKLIVR